MDCKEFRELLDLYVDGELSPEAMLAGQAHLEGCQACSRVEKRLLMLRQAVKLVVREQKPSSELYSRVRLITRPAWRRQLLLSPAAAQRLWRKQIAIPIPAFAVFLIAMLAVGIWRIFPSRSPVSPRNQPAIRKAAPSPDSRSLDLTQFDRGERAAIYKVRLRNPEEKQ